MLYAANGGRALSIHMIPSKSAIVELDMGELEEILRASRPSNSRPTIIKQSAS